MKAPRFAYARPASVAEALALLAEHKDEARVLAGGQSLVPMLNFRVAAPKVLVDINRIAALAGIKVTRNHIRIGALTRHAELERSADIARHLPLVAAAMPHVAHPAIRNRGTFGGSCALCDPAAELPACALARRRGDYAMVGVAAHGSTQGKKFFDMRVVFFGVGDRPLRAAQFERALDGQAAAASAIDVALPKLDADLSPRADFHGSAATKLHLAKVLAARVLTTMEGVVA